MIQKVFVVDIDHTLLNLTNLMSYKIGVPRESFKTPTMQVDGVDYQKILNAWNGVDSVYFDIIQKARSCTIYDFKARFMPAFFTESVFNLIENELVVFVSSSYTERGTRLKSDVVDLYRSKFNSYSEAHVPTDLITFADARFEEHSYKNLLVRLKLMRYHVICVDDNPMRLNWGSQMGCDSLLVPQVWNRNCVGFKRLGV